MDLLAAPLRRSGSHIRSEDGPQKTMRSGINVFHLKQRKDRRKLGQTDGSTKGKQIWDEGKRERDAGKEGWMEPQL